MAESLERGARQAALLDGLALEQKGEVGGGAEGPFAGDAHEIDAALGIKGLQLREQRGDVLAFSEVPGKLGLVERLRCREQQRFQNAQLLLPIRRRARHHGPGRKRQERCAAALPLLVHGLDQHCPLQIVRSHS